MKLIRFIAAADGGSQFIESDIPIDNASTDAFGHLIQRSATVTAQSAMFTEMPEGLNQDWHPASRRQLVVVLSGTVEVEASDGTKHRCGVAPHAFCSHCGMHTFYVPRSQPDRITVNARCLDGIDGPSLKPTRFFDGRHWEDAQRRRIAKGGHTAAAGLNGAVTLKSILDRAPE